MILPEPNQHMLEFMLSLWLLGLGLYLIFKITKPGKTFSESGVLYSLIYLSRLRYYTKKELEKVKNIYERRKIISEFQELVNEYFRKEKNEQP